MCIKDNAEYLLWFIEGFSSGKYLITKDKDWEDISERIKEYFKRTGAQFILPTDIDELHFSVRVKNVLRKLEVKTLSDLINKSPHDLLQCRNFGKTSLREVKRVLEGYNLKLEGRE